MSFMSSQEPIPRTIMDRLRGRTRHKITISGTPLHVYAEWLLDALNINPDDFVIHWYPEPVEGHMAAVRQSDGLCTVWLRTGETCFCCRDTIMSIEQATAERLIAWGIPVEDTP